MRPGTLQCHKLGYLAILACILFLNSFCGEAWGAQNPIPGADPDAETPRLVGRIDEGKLAVLKGNTRPEARAEFDRGPVDSSLPMKDLILVLKRGPAQQAAFEAFLASQQDTASPNYHHWLTPTEIGQKFGPAQADIDTVSQWLRNHGFSIDDVSKDRLFIRFGGSASQVQSAFHAEIHNLDVHGASHIANMSDPQIPAALIPVVVGVKALHNFFPRPMHRLGGLVRRHAQGGGWDRISDSAISPSRPVAPAEGALQINPLDGVGGTTNNLANDEDVAPYDLATIYNFLPLWTAATPIDGTGQTIAIAGTSNLDLDDVTNFRVIFGLPAYTAANAPQVIITNSDPGICIDSYTCLDDLTETFTDVEWSGAAAPGAQILLVTSSVTAVTTDALFASEQYIVENVTAPVMSVGYGECELFLGAAGNATYSSLWSTAQMTGIGVFVPTGTSGSASCDEGDLQAYGGYGAMYGLSVSGVASTPYNTAVGGTDFYWSWDNAQSKYWASNNNSTTQASALGYIPEFAWNATCSNPLIVARFNRNLNENLTAGELCDEIGQHEITEKGYDISGLVDPYGGGGGPSNCINGDGQNVSSCAQGYPKPSWQAGVTGIPQDGVRDIPDVSFFASDDFYGSAYIICLSADFATCTPNQGFTYGEQVGGTSVASSIMAGIAAMLNQKAGGPQGNLNTQLYKLAANETYSNCSTENVPLTGSNCVFYDIDTGTNAMACDIGSPNCSTSGNEPGFAYNVLTGYAATAGYDPTTGLGSINVANLVNAFSAVTPPVTIFPQTVNFPNTPVGVPDPTPFTISVTNTGSTALNISGIVLGGTDAGSYAMTADTCSTTTALAAGSSCKFSVSFTPAIAGTLTASITISDNATGSPQVIDLTGTGYIPTPGFTLSTGRLAFPNTPEGTSATPVPVTLTSSGTAPLILSGFLLVGVNPTYFSQTNTCGALPVTLAVGSSCVINVDFTPASLGDFSAYLGVSSNIAGSTQTVLLTGSGIPTSPAISFNPLSLVFQTTVGTAVPAQSFTVTNTGTAALILSAISIGPDFTQTNNCGTLPVSIAPNEGCTVNVTFSPTTFGGFPESVEFTDNAPGSPQSEGLFGNASERGSYTLAAAAVTISSPGASGTSAITGTGSSGYSGPNTVTLNSCVLATSPSGASDVPTCTLTTPTVTFAAGSNSGAGGLVTINSTGPTAALKQAQLDKGSAFRRSAGAGGVALAGLLLLGIPARRRSWKSMLVLLVFAAAFASLSGCGGGSGGGGGGGGGGGSTGTTTGSYTFTIKGTDSDNVTSVVTLTVTVN